MSDTQKSLWEYILVIASALITLGNALAAISQSQEFVESYGPVVALALVGVALCGVCTFVLLRKRQSSLSAHVVPYYSDKQRKAATWGLVVTPVLLVAISAALVVGGQSCQHQLEPFSDNLFGIIIADFTVGNESTEEGWELAERTSKALKGRLSLAPASVAARVQIQRACAVNGPEQAIQLGESANATLVIWGNLAAHAEDSFDPSFTLVRPLRAAPLRVPDTEMFEFELIRIDRADLPSKISAKATAVAAYVMGVYYLTEAEEYESAPPEFTFAIDTMLPELDSATPETDLERGIRRSVAVFYTLRGVSYAAMGDNVKAREDYREALKHDEGYHGTHVALGNYHYSRREFSVARTYFDRAIALAEYPSGYYGLANCLFYLNQSQDSIAMYLKAIELYEAHGHDPSKVRLVLATVYHLDGQVELAIEQLTIVIESESSDLESKSEAARTLAGFLTPTATPGPIPRVTLTPTMFPTRVPSATPIQPTDSTEAPHTTATPQTILPTMLPTEVPPTVFPTAKPPPTMFPTASPPP